VNNLPKVVVQQRRGRDSNPRLLDRKSDALPRHPCGALLFSSRVLALAPQVEAEAERPRDALCH